MQNRQYHALRHLVLACSLFACSTAATPVQANPLDWLTGEQIQGDGTVQTQNRELGHFNGVALGLPATLELRIGNTESVSVETDGNLMPQIETVVENGMLKIRPRHRNTRLETHHLKIVVQAKNIDHLSLGSSGSIDSDALRGNSLQVNIGGSGSIKIKSIDAQTLSVALGGSGSFNSGGGNANQFTVSIGGSGDVHAGQMAARDVRVDIGGSGQATVWAKEHLNLAIAGSGDVDYYGDPRIDKAVAGSGSVKRLSNAPQ